MARRLKVYRTPIGFHDAYVAAPSQKAALEAWGSDADLFARGVAEQVTDETLTAAPLDRPGEVIRLRRGSDAENMAALPKAAKQPAKRAASPTADDDDGPPPRGRRRASEQKTPSGRPSPQTKARRPQSSAAPGKAAPSQPPRKASGKRPSRARLDKAEAALAGAETKHRSAVAALRAQEQEIQRKRRELEQAHEEEVKRLESRVASARDAYGEALRVWRG